tara:strand:+ start:461 stop:601 length:141 start_codon:yes stop_codon:yes gene_type:complete
VVQQKYILVQKNGKFYIKNGKKVYLDRKTIANNIPYKKNKKNKKNN